MPSSRSRELARAVTQNVPRIIPVDEVESDGDVDAAFEDAVFHRSCYLAGPMTGIEDYNFPAFNKAAADLRSRGWKVYNPADLGEGQTGKGKGQFLEHELAFICSEDCDAIVCLPGWEDSEGANLEVHAARVCEKPVLLYGDELLEIPVAAPSVLVQGLPLEAIPGYEEPKESVCQEADRLVSTDRAAVYGHPIDDFGKVVRAARGLGLNPLDGPAEHALYMILVKLSRLIATPGHHDSIVDICGYAKTYDMVLTEREAREQGGF